VLKSLCLPPSLPADRKNLFAAAVREGRSGGGGRDRPWLRPVALVRLFRAGEMQPVLERVHKVAGEHQLVRLAEQAPWICAAILASRPRLSSFCASGTRDLLFAGGCQLRPTRFAP
jgi:hypothetical protein